MGCHVLGMHASVEAAINRRTSTSRTVGAGQRRGGNGVCMRRGDCRTFSKMVVRSNPLIGRREVYEKKADRWKTIWSMVTIGTWPEMNSE